MKQRNFIIFVLLFVLTASLLIGCSETPTKNTYSVTLYLNNGQKEIVKTVEENSTFNMSEFSNLTHFKTSLEFDCWCIDSTLKIKAPTNPTITTNTTLYARWKLKQGYSTVEVYSGSMSARNILSGDTIIVKAHSESNIYELGDILIYNIENPSATICHEIVEITTHNEEVCYKTKGANNDEVDTYCVHSSQIVGEVVELYMRNGQITTEEINFNKN